MTIRRILFSVALFVAQGNLAWAQREVQPPSALAEAQRMNASLHRVTAELTDVMNDPSVHDGYRQAAIRALAELRRPNAVLPLFNQLLFKAGAITEPAPLTYFPAAQALANYGSNLYSSLHDALSEERSPEYVYVLACLLHTVDGKRIALLRIEKLHAEDGLTAIQRQNVTRLINRLKTTDFDDFRNWPRLKLSEQVKVDLKAEPAD